MENAPNSVFGAAVGLSGRWLAISESNWNNSGESHAAVHLFKHVRGKIRPWKWQQQVEVDGTSATYYETFPEFPLALSEHELAVAAPWPEGLAIYRPDDSETWVQAQIIPEAFGGTVWPAGKILMSDDLLAFSNIGGSLYVFSRDAATGDWQADREFPKGYLNRRSGFFVSGSHLALMRTGSVDQPVRIEFHEKSPEGTWLEEETVELFDPGPFLISAVHMHAAFDSDDFIVVLGHADVLGNPAGGSTLWRISKEASGWEVADEMEISFQSSRVAAHEGCILVHGFTPDILGNPLIGQAAMLDRGFRQRGDLSPPVGTASLDGERFTTSSTRVDFLGNVADQKVTIFKNRWAAWFRRK